ncbi:DegV family protein [Tannockella kyphosi]|uniref:DegV family protein n=1 Tax=Tannockella kyphosi TaxID=2899121 RepID=UPI00201177F0|nr:DegV family protein [Tannockella kyphosi]
MYQIISDGSCDLDADVIAANNLITVPFYVALKGDDHRKEAIEISIRDVYQFMVDNPKTFPRTSLPSMQDYIDVFTPLASQGIDIICLCISSKFSGSINSARLARELVLEDYPDVQITIFDTMAATASQGLLALEACNMMKDDYAYEKAVTRIEELIHCAKIFFTIDSIDYLVQGGRVGKLSGVAAGTLGLKPLVLLEGGEIVKAGVVRGRKVSKRKVLELLISYIEDNDLDPSKFHFVTGYGFDKNEGLVFRDMVIDTLQQKYPDCTFPMELIQIGATIGVHTGPSPLGVALIEKYDI